MSKLMQLVVVANENLSEAAVLAKDGHITPEEKTALLKQLQDIADLEWFIHDKARAVRQVA